MTGDPFPCSEAPHVFRIHPATLPKQLEHLAELAFDLRLIGSKTMSNIWRRLDPEAWSRCNNPYMVLQHAHQEQLEQAAADEASSAN